MLNIYWRSWQQCNLHSIRHCWDCCKIEKTQIYFVVWLILVFSRPVYITSVIAVGWIFVVFKGQHKNFPDEESVLWWHAHNHSSEQCRAHTHCCFIEWVESRDSCSEHFHVFLITLTWSWPQSNLSWPLHWCIIGAGCVLAFYLTRVTHSIHHTLPSGLHLPIIKFPILQSIICPDNSFSDLVH